ncbi:class I SAM-dependent methyltransferase [Brevibacterium album]|uniref:class I SAM-dependent methyltransferase n=1 Tax=Brevibacterium album TaxID=417948 RepID=UPI000404ECF4|nr:class I SAM-dependent methyltransferase [Brevibacterium album]
MTGEHPKTGAQPAEHDHSGFWEESLDADWTERGVGYQALGLAFNSWMYRAREEVFMREAGRAGVGRGTRVLDIGSGTGLYIRWWSRMLPAEVSGSDLTTAAVRNLRERFPENRFEQLDITSGTGPFEPGSFDVVSCMDVLFHITDDEAYRAALRNIAALLRPGGTFVLTENFVHRPAARVPAESADTTADGTATEDAAAQGAAAHEHRAHQTNRSLAWIEDALAEAGLRLEHRTPHLVLMNAQVDAPWLWRKAWGGALRAATLTEATGGLAGRMLHPLERTLARRFRESPTTELAFARKE